ncbi:hypothetical protein QN219_31530 [Sinorhizobium sp. 7-81]|nr:hypothetical protein [Sinorhizobium sp. 8-89]MDK1494471.1 hypothetical protein [Sinorhizobium sp. 8-89]
MRRFIEDAEEGQHIVDVSLDELLGFHRTDPPHCQNVVDIGPSSGFRAVLHSLTSWVGGHHIRIWSDDVQNLSQNLSDARAEMVSSDRLSRIQ